MLHKIKKFFLTLIALISYPISGSKFQHRTQNMKLKRIQFVLIQNFFIALEKIILDMSSYSAVLNNFSLMFNEYC